MTKKFNKRLYMAKWREENREVHRAYMREHYKKQRQKVDSFKNRPCTDCNVQYPPYVMDFDHKDPKTKKYTIGNMHFKMGQIEEEISKCDLVCANCHRERTHQQWLKRQINLGRPIIFEGAN